jgi:hypothetical protein
MANVNGLNNYFQDYPWSFLKTKPLASLPTFVKEVYIAGGHGFTENLLGTLKYYLY